MMGNETVERRGGQPVSHFPVKVEQRFESELHLLIKSQQGTLGVRAPAAQQQVQFKKHIFISKIGKKEAFQCFTAVKVS